ncbi:hypothetical protein Dimus_022686, partial [Dionaea muscipula]
WPAAPWYEEPVWWSEAGDPPSPANPWPANSLRWQEEVILQLEWDLKQIQDRYNQKMQQSKREIAARFEQSKKEREARLEQNNMEYRA